MSDQPKDLSKIRFPAPKRQRPTLSQLCAKVTKNRVVRSLLHPMRAPITVLTAATAVAYTADLPMSAAAAIGLSSAYAAAMLAEAVHAISETSCMVAPTIMSGARGAAAGCIAVGVGLGVPDGIKTFGASHDNIHAFLGIMVTLGVGVVGTRLLANLITKKQDQIDSYVEDDFKHSLKMLNAKLAKLRPSWGKSTKPLEEAKKIDPPTQSDITQLQQELAQAQQQIKELQTLTQQQAEALEQKSTSPHRAMQRMNKKHNV